LAGDRIAIEQVDKPVGVNGRSSLELTHTLAQQFAGVVQWARDTEAFDSILRSFIRFDVESVALPDLPDEWHTASRSSLWLEGRRASSGGHLRRIQVCADRFRGSVRSRRTTPIMGRSSWASGLASTFPVQVEWPNF
jgi:hypothetical protein